MRNGPGNGLAASCSDTRQQSQPASPIIEPDKGRSAVGATPQADWQCKLIQKAAINVLDLGLRLAQKASSARNRLRTLDVVEEVDPRYLDAFHIANSRSLSAVVQ
ncbi:hypothetical protein K3Z96_18705, partial [Pseudomonas aeruginosa]|nr:hypothetical protein [Pseudomonas aeruginosa]